MSNKQHFFKMPFSIMHIQGLSLTDKNIYGVILSLANKTGVCTASNSYIAEQLGVSIKTIERGFKKLRDIGLIETLLIFEEGTKRILKRNTKVVPSYLSNDTLKNKDTLPSYLSNDTLADEGDNRGNTIDKNNRDKAVASLPSEKDKHSKITNNDLTNELFDTCWKEYTYMIESWNAKNKDKRKVCPKGKSKEKFIILAKQYGAYALSCFVRKMLSSSAYDLINILNEKKYLEKNTLTILARQDETVLSEVFFSDVDEFDRFMREIEERL